MKGRPGQRYTHIPLNLDEQCCYYGSTEWLSKKCTPGLGPRARCSRVCSLCDRTARLLPAALPSTHK